MAGAPWNAALALLPAWWRGRSPRLRATLAACAALAAVVAAAAAFALRDTSLPLFAGTLRPAQVAEVGDRLASWGIPFRTSADNVEVPRALRRATLLRLALAGVPQRPLPSSLETLADAGPLTPDRVLEVRQRAGLEGEIAQSLRTLEGIFDARVIIAPGHAATFADEAATPATASVRISPRAGSALDAARVQAVRAFVAAAVPGLLPERVQVLDDRGEAFDAATAAPGEDSLEARLQSALDRVEGLGATLVRVHVVRADDARELLLRRIVPAGGALRSESAQEEYRNGGGAYRSGHNAAQDGSDEREERAQLPSGRIRRVSIAVFVDRSRAGDLSKIRELVEGAAAVDPRRGDEVRVEALEFAHPLPVTPRSPVPLLLAALLPALLVGASLIVAALLARPLAALLAEALRGAGLRRAVERTPPPLAEARRLRAALDVEPPHAAAAVISALPASTAVAVLDLYPAEERERIVRRMATARADAIPSLESILGKYS
ncbi:hypothetical protein EPN52_00040 [bacterium]|nr:MAG: hypothetical protein EPN52_00040 [bacterium]